MNAFTKRNPIHFTFQNTGIREGILFFIVCIIIFWCFSNDELVESGLNRSTSLKTDGYIIIPRVTNPEKALSLLPEGYALLDYKYTIRGCSLSTFHRDVTSSPYIYNTKHPVYTFIVYHNAGPALSVCPGSHRTTPFAYTSPLSILSNPNDTPMGVLFHCDLLHAGAINSVGEYRFVEQYKIAHVDDLSKLGHLQGINMEKIGKCNISYPYEIFTRKMSWMFSHITNHHLTPYLQNRSDTHMGKMLLSLYGRDFYNK